jgi:hypothetical protein
MNNNIVFVGGSGRSGTNITKKIFSKHSEIATLPFEHRFIIDPDGLVDYLNAVSASWSPFHIDKHTHRLENYLRALSRRRPFQYRLGQLIKTIDKSGRKFTPPGYHGWELSRWFPRWDERVEQLISELAPSKFPGCWPGVLPFRKNNRMYFGAYGTRGEIAHKLGKFVKGCFDDHLKWTGKSIFLEDNTWNILYGRELLEMLPGAKLIHVYRDPRDVVASFVRQRWCPSNVGVAVEWYKSIMERWADVKQKLDPASYFEFPLEDLVANPQATLHELCRFIGIDMETKMLEVDLSQNNTGRWRKDLSPHEQALVCRELRPLLRRYEYENTPAQPQILKKK